MPTFAFGTARFSALSFLKVLNLRVFRLTCPASPLPFFICRGFSKDESIRFHVVLVEAPNHRHGFSSFVAFLLSCRTDNSECFFYLLFSSCWIELGSINRVCWIQNVRQTQASQILVGPTPTTLLLLAC